MSSFLLIWFFISEATRIGLSSIAESGAKPFFASNRLTSSAICSAVISSVIFFFPVLSTLAAKNDFIKESGCTSNTKPELDSMAFISESLKLKARLSLTCIEPKR
ncbi:hypothetical protein D3C73_993740 [compost metagenome]